ncbi:MAG: hypothetical protein HYY51_04675 [Candidatus Magasanikbacteria bacterium]|nr:hypothetical protein [Candidatus Magasanikbacteria bacterium]
MEGKKVNIRPLFEACGMDLGDLEIIETPGMYPYKETIEENWAYFTTVGSQRLKEQFEKEHKKTSTIGIVGICSGVEGIAISHIFGGGLKRLIVTDIDQEILEGTITNIKNATALLSYELIPLVGLFCEPIESSGHTVDFVHANIPNLPTSGEEDLSKGDQKGSFAPPEYYEKYRPPKEFIYWALAAQYAYLQSAKRVIKPGGSVIAELGGRVPFELVEELFDSCGLELQEVIIGFKEQTEAMINFRGYHHNEVEYGVQFEYYTYDESKYMFEKYQLANPNYNISGRELKKLLKPYKLNAGQAMEAYKKGTRIGHLVHLLRGMKN